MSQPAAILFYSKTTDHACFSNFSPHPIELDGKTWPTSEHYYQAQKFVGTEHEEMIRQTQSPGKAKRMGRSPKVPIRPDWEAVKDDVMRKVVMAKFTQHDDLRAILLATGDVELIEHTTNDSYWGDGGDGSGRNMLGRILMEVRERLRKEISSKG
ncbi:MAG: NADAR family protein [Gemmataceae bacterium]